MHRWIGVLFFSKRASWWLNRSNAGRAIGQRSRNAFFFLAFFCIRNTSVLSYWQCLTGDWQLCQSRLIPGCCRERS
ncbi:hypothetical protein F5Y14DRAFT_337518 [Nemania sp. NC0429]|nr:hypothetical protein F5Y14DRAFT_337518 [Nemania sp. NC0429]